MKTKTEVCVVDNRIFLLGLDKLYRKVIKPHEEGELLDCAREVSAKLKVGRADVPVEGYYTESKELTEYFLTVRALQAQPIRRANEVDGTPSFERLKEVTKSPIFGRAEESKKLLPPAWDPLGKALKIDVEKWSVTALTEEAKKITETSDDYSLTGLAALSGDSVALTALRETVALYVGVRPGALPVPTKYIYEWKVDPEIEARAKKFVQTFNELFDENLPTPHEEHAETYFRAADLWGINQRCVCIGKAPIQPPWRYYHWAVDVRSSTEVVVRDFWDDELWTTEHYKEDRKIVLLPEGGNAPLAERESLWECFVEFWKFIRGGGLVSIWKFIRSGGSRELWRAIRPLFRK